MGKIRNKKLKTKPSNVNKPEPPPISSDIADQSSVYQLLPKDSDLTSVRSLKSMKNKFGIKKIITKKEKLELRKEMLKQKMDYIKEIAAKPESKKTKSKKTKNITDDKKVEDIFRTFVKDEEEEYVKLANNKPKKGIAKRKKRCQQIVKDVNSLKSLMFKKS